MDNSASTSQGNSKEEKKAKDKKKKKKSAPTGGDLGQDALEKLHIVQEEASMEEEGSDRSAISSGSLSSSDYSKGSSKP